jgi:hypothetical protein
MFKKQKKQNQKQTCKKKHIYIYMRLLFGFRFFVVLLLFRFFSFRVGGKLLAHTYHTAIQLPKGISPDIHGLGSASKPLTNEDAHPNPRLIGDAQWNHPKFMGVAG